jgi:tripartite-type tricarboxylate transporter receptor subunit TctC
VVPVQAAAKAPPDGYTLLFFGPTLWVLPLLQDNVSYDPLRDFAPISAVARSPNVLVVHPSLPVKNVKDLIALARSHPAQLNYAGALSGSTTHISAELFKSMAGVDIVRVPFKGNGPSITAVVGGEVQMMFASPSGVVPHTKSGRLRALAVTSMQPTALLPGLPTVSDTGLPGYESVSLQGLHAPAQTPMSVIRRLNQELVQALRKEELREKFFNAGLDTVGSSSEEFVARIRQETSRLSKVIKDANIRAE